MSRYSTKQFVDPMIQQNPPIQGVLTKRIAAPAAISTKAVAPSLPPAPNLSPAPPLTTPSWRLPKNSVVRKKAVAIIAMRAQGFTTDEIAHELHIKPASVCTYVYRAGRNGMLTNKRGESAFDDPKDCIDYELAHKVVRNMNAALDDMPVTLASGEIKDISKVMYETTMRLAEGALFKRFDQAHDTSALPGMQVLAVKIEMPQTGGVVVREGSIGGVPAYSSEVVEGQVDDARQRD